MMRILALIFSAISFYGLLQLVNVEIYQFIPVHSYGSEGGLIVAAMALMFGGGAALVALLFAFLHYRRTRSSVFSRYLMAWCWLVIFGFIGVLAYMELDYQKSRTRPNTSLAPIPMNREQAGVGVAACPGYFWGSAAPAVASLWRDKRFTSRVAGGSALDR